MTTANHLKAVAIAEVDRISLELARIAPHLQGQEHAKPGQSLKSLLLTMAEEINERYEH